MLTNRTQGKVSVSGLTYNNLLEDTYNALKDSDAFKNNFTDFTSNTAERMIVELYAYVAQQIANRIDQVGNELFVDTASASGMSRLLKLVGAKIDFPAAATAKVTVESSVATNQNISLSKGINNNADELEYTMDSFKSIKAAGNNTSWEFIDYSVDKNTGNKVFNYITPYAFDSASTKQSFQIVEGVTRSKLYTVKSTGIDIITLDNVPVIKDSVRIYYKKKRKTEGSSSAVEIKEYYKVDNFFTTEAINKTVADRVGCFTEHNLGNGKCEITIKPYSNDANENDINEELLIMYRIGGGEIGNISANAINQTERFIISDNLGRQQGYGWLNIYNTTAGNGGTNEKTVDEIRSTVINEVRNTKLAVTEDDYEYLLPKYDTNVKVVKCYGEKNKETARLAGTYGYYANPLTVWLILLKQNQQLNNEYINGSSNITERINDICFNYLDINPRFNEVYQIKKASLNQTLNEDELRRNFKEDIHTYSIKLNDEAADIIKTSENAIITTTVVPFLEKEGVSAEHVFDRYRSESIVSITWSELLRKTGLRVGDAFIVTDEDVNGTINGRWVCFKNQEGGASAINVLRAVDTDYIYDNLITADKTEAVDIDKMWIDCKKTDEGLDFSRTRSYISTILSGDFSNVELPINGTITINGTEINLKNINTLDGIKDAINNSMAESANVIYLKSNIAAGDSDPADVIVNENHVGGTFNFTINGINHTIVVNGGTYGNLSNALKTELESAGITCAYLFANECYNLALVSKNGISYADNSTDALKLCADYLGNDEAQPLNSSVVAIQPAEREGLEDYLTSNEPASVVGNILLIGSDGNMTITASSEELRKIFGIGSSFTGRNFREITCTTDGLDNDIYLQIKTASSIDTIKDTIYINVFGGEESQIKLGEYYENLDKYLSAPEIIINLLKREALKHLYSTNYIANDDGDRVIDKYGSDYQIKFSAGLVSAQTFNQLSSNSAPATVYAVGKSPDTLRQFKNGVIYIKVNNIPLVPGDISAEEGENDFEFEGGYVKLDLEAFAGKTKAEFISDIASYFDELDYFSDENDRVGFKTKTSDFRSSIDFGKTDKKILAELFGITESVVKSPEGQINAKQIKYISIPFTKNLALSRNMAITINNGSPVTIKTGLTLEEFTNNVNNSAVGGRVAIDNRRIIFKSLENGHKITIRLNGDDWEGMFGEVLDEMFEAEYSEEERIIGYRFEATNDGDYYIDYVENSETGDMQYNLVIENGSAFPSGPIYVHMYEDYSEDHVLTGKDDTAIYTDEYNWNSLMSKKKVMLAEHVYKQPRFVPFDLDLTVYISNSQYYRRSEYANNVMRYLKEVYGIYSNNIGDSLTVQDISLAIRERFPEATRVVVNYLGYEMSNKYTNQDVLEVDFNQKLLIASDKTSVITQINDDRGLVESTTVYEHGLKLNVVYDD